MIAATRSCVLYGAAVATLVCLPVLASSLPACTSGVVNVVQISGEGGGDAGPIEPADADVADVVLPVPDSSTASPKNPYGVPYPTANIGTDVRAGSRKGSVIANLSFTGYVPSASGTSTVQLVDLFDPQGKTHGIVALLLASGWDVVSKNMMQTLQGSGLPTRVAVVSVLGEGKTAGTPATLANLTSWRTQVGIPQAWFLLDPSFNAFPNALYDKTAVPAVIILDARTMEIVSAELGAPPQPKQALEAFRDDVSSRGPSY